MGEWVLWVGEIVGWWLAAGIAVAAIWSRIRRQARVYEDEYEFPSERGIW